ncbi:hypothetical protein FRC06_000732 [Ceratobasidium sp. 370]|nr:hypothetical protein FRC06_000732 [Ceratobasidium sp. 370]
MNVGLATGVYSKAMWSDAQGLVKANIPRQYLDPEWCLCHTWNQVCWFAKKGVKLDPCAFGYDIMERPPRKVQPAQILSLAYPPGSTIVIEEDDELLPYVHCDPLPITMSVVHRSPEGELMPLVGPPPLVLPSLTLLSSSVRAALSMRGAVSAVRLLPSADFESNPFLVGLQKTSLSEKGKATYVSPALTLVASDSRLSTPPTEFEMDNGPNESPVYVHKSTCVASPHHSTSDVICLGHGGTSGRDPQPSSSQQSINSSQYDINNCQRGAPRLSALRNLCHNDQDVEAHINAYVILNMLAAVHLPDESIDEVKAAAAALWGP